jgi:hypothetical protein
MFATDTTRPTPLWYGPWPSSSTTHTNEMRRVQDEIRAAVGGDGGCDDGIVKLKL